MLDAGIIQTTLALLGALALLGVLLVWRASRRRSGRRRAFPKGEWGDYLEKMTEEAPGPPAPILPPPAGDGGDEEKDAPPPGEESEFQQDAAPAGETTSWREGLPAPAGARPGADAEPPPARTPERESAPGVSREEELFSLVQREGGGEDAPSGGAVLQEETGAERAANFAGAVNSPPGDDAGGRAVPADPGAAPPSVAGSGSRAASDETSSGRVRELVAELCPGDLLLMESLERELPGWAADAADAARADLEERQRGRRPPAPEEYLRLGILEVILGRGDRATRHLKESLRRTSAFGPVLNALAVTSCLREKMEPAISYCREAAREAGRDASVQAAVAQNLGSFYERKGEGSRAAESYEAALRYIGPQGEAGRVSRLRMRVGQLFLRQGAYEKAGENLSEAAHAFHVLGEAGNEARAHVALASARTRAGKCESAQDSLEVALGLCRKNADKTGEALVYGQMGVTFAAQQQLTRALCYYENALGLNREIGNKRGEAASLDGIGGIHCARGDFPEAREAYEAALEISREGGRARATAKLLRNLGRIHLEQGEREAARARLLEALGVFRRIGAADAAHQVAETLEGLDGRP